MTTIGYDATHDNVSSIPLDAAVVLGYDTGTVDIRWTAEDWSRFATKRRVHIDQGGPGSPVLTSQVRDVEQFAWDVTRAVQDTAGWNVPRPTIYCNQNTLPRVLAAGWKRDLWLAIPDWQPGDTLPEHSPCEVVAVQSGFDGDHDTSFILDDNWALDVTPNTGVQFPAPEHPSYATAVFLKWDAVAPVNGQSPSGYTVVFFGLDGKEYYRDVTTATEITAVGLHRDWTFNVFVWANGGAIAPPHATIQVQT